MFVSSTDIITWGIILWNIRSTLLASTHVFTNKVYTKTNDSVAQFLDLQKVHPSV